MKAACLTNIKRIEIHEVPDPVPQKGQLLVKVESSGICGSDIHYFYKGAIGDAVSRYPHFLGHEPSGTVVEAPYGSKFKPGDRVVIDPAGPCMKCEFCLRRQYNICPNVKFLGSPGIQGAFQEYIVLEEDQLAGLPDDIGFDEGAMLEPMGVAYHAVVTLANLQPGDSVGIFGAGAIGLLVLALAKYRGCGISFITDPLDYRLKFAQKYLQPDFAVNPEKADIVEFVREKTYNRGLDVTFDAAGVRQSISHTFETARIGGQALLIGIPSADFLEYNPHGMRRKELIIRNVRRSNRDMESCLKMLAEGTVDLKPYPTHHFRLQQIGEAFDMVYNYKNGVIRAMIHP